MAGCYVKGNELSASHISGEFLTSLGIVSVSKISHHADSKTTIKQNAVQISLQHTVRMYSVYSNNNILKII
jgi:hypothetical protein